MLYLLNRQSSTLKTKNNVMRFVFLNIKIAKIITKVIIYLELSQINLYKISIIIFSF